MKVERMALKRLQSFCASPSMGKHRSPVASAERSEHVRRSSPANPIEDGLEPLGDLRQHFTWPTRRSSGRWMVHHVHGANKLGQVAFLDEVGAVKVVRQRDRFQ